MKLVINLLPATYRRRQLIRRRAIQWGVTLGVVLLAIGCGRWLERREYHALRKQLEAAIREAQPAQVMLREITKMRKQIDDLQEYETVAQELEQQRQVLPLLGMVGRSAQASQGRLRVLELRCDELQSIVATDPKQNHDNDRAAGSVKLVGVALDSPAVAEFHESLVDTAMFADIKLIKSNERKVSNLALYDYEVNCEL